MGKELKNREEALKNAQAALVQSEKMAAFGQLGAGIAHEVKNPLTGIIGYTQMTKSMITDQGALKNLDIIEKETKRCKAIVENLMRFARQEKPSLEPSFMPQVVRDSIDLVDHQLSTANIKIIKKLAQDMPLCMANSNQIQQVLMNLMINASHAMEGGGTLTVSLETENNKALIKLVDTGKGIPEHIKKRIFEPFFTTKPAGKGTGLGLSVSFGIIKDHNGELSFESTEGKGTTFFIRIPFGDENCQARKEEVMARVSKFSSKSDIKTDEAPAAQSVEHKIQHTMTPAPTKDSSLSINDLTMLSSLPEATDANFPPMNNSGTEHSAPLLSEENALKIEIAKLYMQPIKQVEPLVQPIQSTPKRTEGPKILSELPSQDETKVREDNKPEQIIVKTEKPKLSEPIKETPPQVDLKPKISTTNTFQDSAITTSNKALSEQLAADDTFSIPRPKVRGTNG